MESIMETISENKIQIVSVATVTAMMVLNMVLLVTDFIS